MNVKQKPANKKNSSPGQLSLPWNQYQVLENPEVEEIAEKFTRTNCFKPWKFANLVIGYFSPSIASVPNARSNKVKVRKKSRLEESVTTEKGKGTA